MAEKRMLIVDSDLLAKIDANRGDMSQAEFLKFLIENQLGSEGEAAVGGSYVEREEFQKFVSEMKDLLRRFLDFFMSYGMQLNDNPQAQSFEELTQKLQVLANNGAKYKRA